MRDPPVDDPLVKIPTLIREDDGAVMGWQTDGQAGVWHPVGVRGMRSRAVAQRNAPPRDRDPLAPDFGTWLRHHRSRDPLGDGLGDRIRDFADDLLADPQARRLRSAQAISVYIDGFAPDYVIAAKNDAISEWDAWSRIPRVAAHHQPPHLIIHCPYCKKRHLHGDCGVPLGGDLTPALGHREAHCVNLPRSEAGYILVLPPPPRQVRLYRLYNDVGALLYVGISDHPPHRVDQHYRGKPWAPEVTNIRFGRWFPDRESAHTAEILAIQAERPRYNIADTTS